MSDKKISELKLNTLLNYYAEGFDPGCSIREYNLSELAEKEIFLRFHNKSQLIYKCLEVIEEVVHRSGDLRIQMVINELLNSDEVKKYLKQVRGRMKCDSCGKFRKEEDIIGVWGEGNEQWTECFYCCAKIDRKAYFKDRIEKQGEENE